LFSEEPEEITPHNVIHHYEEIYANIPSVYDARSIPIVRKGIFSKLNTKRSIFHASKQKNYSKDEKTNSKGEKNYWVEIGDTYINEAFSVFENYANEITQFFHQKYVHRKNI
jgi:hypothetical protein